MIVCDLPSADERHDEISEAITSVNYGSSHSDLRGSKIL